MMRTFQCTVHTSVYASNTVASVATGGHFFAVGLYKSLTTQ